MEDDLVQTAAKVYAEETVIHLETRILYELNLWLILDDWEVIYQHKVLREGRLETLTVALIIKQQHRQLYRLLPFPRIPTHRRTSPLQQQLPLQKEVYLVRITFHQESGKLVKSTI